jgi:hypothetical protein
LRADEIGGRLQETQDASVLLLIGWTIIGWLAWALGGRIWPTEVVMRVRVVERTPDASGVASSERGGAA